MKYTITKERNRKTGVYYPKYKIVYRDGGKFVKSEMGYTDKALTRKKAERESERLESEKHNNVKPFLELIEDYITSKSPKGGWKGTPWSSDQIKRTRVELTWWGESLKITDLSKIKLVAVETAIENYPKELAGKTKNWKVSKLRALVKWCLKREYFQSDPLKGWENYREEDKDPKRALNRTELARLWQVITPQRKIAYMAAMLTGMRRKEISSLKVSDLDLIRGGITLDWENEKNSKGSFFHLPESFLNMLEVYVRGRNSDEKLFDISIHHASENLRRDLKRANIEFRTDKGKVVFHSLRKTFLTLLSRAGNDAKTVQKLGRHSDPNITFGIYVDSEEEREKSTIEGLYKSFDPIMIVSDSDKGSSPDGMGLQKVPPRRIEPHNATQAIQSQTKPNPDIEDAKRKLRKHFGWDKPQPNQANQGHTIRSDIDLMLLTYAEELLWSAPSEQIKIIIDILKPKRKRA